MRLSLIRGCIVIITAVLILLDAEIFLRTINYPWHACQEIYTVSEAKFAQFDDELGWSYIPHRTTVGDYGEKYIINHEGYRAASQDYKTDFTKPIILIIGDSMLFGHGLNFEDTFGYKLKKALNGKFEVLNFAVQAYGTDQVYIMLKRVFPKYRPQVIIMNTYAEQVSRNVNRDRREFTTLKCSKITGTKPRFTLRNGILTLADKPQRFSDYDNPRLLLLAKRFVDGKLESRSQKSGLEITRALINEIEFYTRWNNARLYIINIDNSDQAYLDGSNSNALGITTYAYGSKKSIYHVSETDAHPNTLGTTMMVERFMSQFTGEQSFR